MNPDTIPKINSYKLPGMQCRVIYPTMVIGLYVQPPTQAPGTLAHSKLKKMNLIFCCNYLIQSVNNKYNHNDPPNIEESGVQRTIIPT